MTTIKIKEYKVPGRGANRVSITLPKVWIDDLQLHPGDRIEFYRDEADRLILIPKKEEQKAG